MSTTNGIDEIVKTATDGATRVFNEAFVPTVNKGLDNMNQYMSGTGTGTGQAYYENVDPSPHIILQLDHDNTNYQEASVDTTQTKHTEENDVSSEENVERNEKLKENKNSTVQTIIKDAVGDNTFNVALNMVKNRLGVNEVTVQSLMTLVKYSMEAVEISKLKGSEQREMALRLVRYIIVDAPISHEQERICLDMLDTGLLGQTMDLVVDATNGHVGINQVIGLTEACCFSFLGARKKRTKYKGRAIKH